MCNSSIKYHTYKYVNKASGWTDRHTHRQMIAIPMSPFSHSGVMRDNYLYNMFDPHSTILFSIMIKGSILQLPSEMQLNTPIKTGKMFLSSVKKTFNTNL